MRGTGRRVHAGTHSAKRAREQGAAKRAAAVDAARAGGGTEPGDRRVGAPSALLAVTIRSRAIVAAGDTGEQRMQCFGARLQWLQWTVQYGSSRRNVQAPACSETSTVFIPDPYQGMPPAQGRLPPACGSAAPRLRCAPNATLACHQLIMTRRVLQADEMQDTP